MSRSPSQSENPFRMRESSRDSLVDIDVRIKRSDTFGTDTENHAAEPGERYEDDLAIDEHEQADSSDNVLSAKEAFKAFSEDELVELEILRDQEIDAMSDQGLLPQKDRWNEGHRNGFCFNYPEMTLEIITGDGYPVKPLTHQVTNISLPRIVIDQLRAVLRESHTIDSKANTLRKWQERELHDTGFFEFEMAALHIVAKCIAHLKHFRCDPAYWRTQATTLRRTDHAMSFDRRWIMGEMYGLPNLLPDLENPAETYDPFNPDWSKKVTDLTDEQELDLANVQHQSEIRDSMWGIETASVQGHELANTILSKTPEEVCAEIPEQFRILHIESVIRSDRVAKYLACQSKIRKDLEKLPLNILRGSLKRETRMELGKRTNEQDTLIDHLITPELTFHCTREDLIPSIVRQGFLMPELEKDIRCGATYGQGIYSSPDPLFSLMYTGFRFEPTKFNEFAGLKLIACATITGITRYMTREDGWRQHNKPYPGAHSHVANNLMEYVVFDEAQIIPCYVIHLDLGRDAARYIANLSKDPVRYISKYREQQRKLKRAEKKRGQVILGPGDLQRQKQALLAKAQKYFPYGYGAARGSKFVVEEVGEVSEDEEDYGVYQKDRLDDDGEAAHDIWTMDDHTTFALDSDGDFSDEGIGSDGDGKEPVGGDEVEEKVDWAYKMGPEGRTKFDEFYEARKAKVKKRGRVQRRDS